MLPCDASSVAAARRLVRGELAAHGDVPGDRVDLVDAASLLGAEVTDGNPTFPTPRRPLGLAGTGRGLLLMDDLASRWGVSPSGVGKTVWFELTFAS